MSIITTPPKSVIGLDSEGMAYYSDHPVEFVEDHIFSNIKGQTPTLHQKQGLQAIADYQRVTIKSGHGTGKDALASMIIIWFLCTRPFPVVPCTAPTQSQLKHILWREISKWLSQCNMKYMLEWAGEKIYNPEEAERWFAVAKTSGKPDNMSGFHEDHMLFFIDEASGVPQDIMTVIESACTAEDNRILMAGNPTQIVGGFYDSHTVDKDLWKCLHFNSEDSPIVSKQWVSRMRKKWGRTSDIYKVRVLGEFPKGNPDSFIQLSDVMAAVNRDIGESWFKDNPDFDYLEIGVDVARFGDDLTCICIRRGMKVLEITTLSKKNLVEVQDKVLQVLRKHRKELQYEEIVKIKVDETGLGAGVVDMLRENTWDNIEIVGCNNGAMGDAEYGNAVSKMWAEFKGVLSEIDLPAGENGRGDENLVAELATRRYGFDKKNRTLLEPKSDFKKQYGQSPDRADAVILAFTQSQDLKRVVPTYNQNEEVYDDFKINWTNLNMLTTKFFISMYQKPSMETAVIGCLWDAYDAKLTIFYESIHDTPAAEEIAFEFSGAMNQIAKNSGISPRDFMWYCNQEMMGKRGAVAAGGAGQSAQGRWQPGSADLFNKLQIYPQANNFYNEWNAIAMLDQIVRKGMVQIHETCELLNRQLGTWSIDVQKKDTMTKPKDQNNGLCLALTQIVSLLFENSPVAVTAPKFRPYSPEREKMNERVNNNFNFENPDRFNQHGPAGGKQKQDWMKG